MTQFPTTLTDLTSNDDGRRAGPPRLLTVHTFEGQDLSIERMMDYQSGRLAHQRTGSYHVVIDAPGRSGRENDNPFIPWAAGWNGNRSALHVCLAGRAAFTRAEWLARPAQLDTLARFLAFEGPNNRIPLARVAGAAVRTGTGVCGHRDWSIAYPRDTDHTDPGDGFPWDYVLALAIRHRDGTPAPPKPSPPRAPTTGHTMDQEQAKMLAENHGQLTGSTAAGKFPGWPQLNGMTIVDALAAIGAKLELDGFGKAER